MREQDSVAEIARRHKIHPNIIVYKWKRQLLENLSSIFESEGSGNGSDSVERESELLRKIGELTVERDFLADGLGRLR